MKSASFWPRVMADQMILEWWIILSTAVTGTWKCVRGVSCWHECIKCSSVAGDFKHLGVTAAFRKIHQPKIPSQQRSCSQDMTLIRGRIMLILQAGYSMSNYSVSNCSAGLQINFHHHRPGNVIKVPGVPKWMWTVLKSKCCFFIIIIYN